MSLLTTSRKIQPSINRISPKLGVRWDITNNLSLRAAVFRWIKPTLAANQTLEPTQVAGFNQVYDDNNGDESLRRGVGLDWRLTKQLFVGAEATWRDLRVPANTASDVTVFDTEKEQLHRSLSVLDANRRISLSAQVVYDAFEAQTGLDDRFYFQRVSRHSAFLWRRDISLQMASSLA